MAADSSKTDLARRGFHAHWTKETARYADTDRQGHVNNAVFVTFLESGRVGILYNPERPMAPAGASFVIARLTLDFLSEIQWPNDIMIGTSVLRLGTSSITLGQGIFVNDICVAVAETVIVMTDESTRKSTPLQAEARDRLAALMGRDSPAK
jgi:acyl-CoA thioester hydrolase